jgi:RNA-binding motif X-linked protein 2
MVVLLLPAAAVCCCYCYCWCWLQASWHARFAHSAYIFAGGLDYELTEGDLLAVFAQYGELVDVHLVRDKTTGKSKGFAFLAYEDQRSTVLAVDNLSGAVVAGRKIRVEHVDNYKKRKAEVRSSSSSTITEGPKVPAAAAIKWLALLLPAASLYMDGACSCRVSCC